MVEKALLYLYCWATLLPGTFAPPTRHNSNQLWYSCTTTADNHSSFSEFESYCSACKQACVSYGVTVVLFLFVALLYICGCPFIPRRRNEVRVKRKWNPLICMAAGRSERMPLLEHRNNKGIYKISLWTYLRSQPISSGCIPNIDEDTPTEVVVRNVSRLHQSMEDEEKSLLISSKLFESFGFDLKLEDIGSRLQKYWYLRHNHALLQFTAKKSTKLPFLLSEISIKALKNIFHSLRHRFILQIEDIDYKEDYVSVLMEKIPSGSLRDIIYQARPTDDWQVKYTESSKRIPFSVDEIKTCCSHVLQAVNYLYGLRIQAIGQIHCGNVFFKDGCYLLGGYENVFLGYKTSIYSKIAAQGLLSHIDLIMFGHMIYEMYTGMIQDKVLLENIDLENIPDHEMKDILKYTFGKKLRKKKHPMKALLHHKFFHQSGNLETEPLLLSGEAEWLLEVMKPHLFGR